MHIFYLKLFLSIASLFVLVPSAALADTCEADFSSVEIALQAAMEERFAEYIGEAAISRYPHIHSVWRHALPKNWRTCLDSDQKRLAYRSLRSVSINNDNANFLADLDMMWRALDADWQAKEAEGHHRALIMQRDLSAAAHLRERFPDIAVPLEIATCETCESARTYLVLSTSGLERRTIDIVGYSGLLVVGQPGCVFTRAMWDSIKNDPDISTIVRDQAIWLADSWTDLSHETFADYSALVPDMPFNPVWKQSEWPEIDNWSSPTVYAYRDGKVVGRHVGWPRGKEEATKARLRALIALTRN